MYIINYENTSAKIKQKSNSSDFFKFFHYTMDIYILAIDCCPFNII